MLFVGLSPQVAQRRPDLVFSLMRMSISQQNEFLGVMWEIVRITPVTSLYRRDLGELTAAVKRTQILEEATGFPRPH